jgi:hypothetical protein
VLCRSCPSLFCDCTNADVIMQVMNKRRQRLRCSHYLPILEGNRAGQHTKFPCVIYCHGNCGYTHTCAHTHMLSQKRNDAQDYLRALTNSLIHAAHTRIAWSAKCRLNVKIDGH